MYTSTTPTLTFTLPFQASDIDDLYLSIWQEGNELEIEKRLTDVICKRNKLSIKLSLEETNSLIPNKKAYTQLQCHTVSGDSWIASNEVELNIKRTHKKITTETPTDSSTEAPAVPVEEEE